MEEKIARKKIRKILLENFLKEDNGEKRFPLNMPVASSDKEDILKIREILLANNFKMYIVGGAVRDAVKNEIKLQKNPMDTTIDVPKDFDLATNAFPDQIRTLFEKAPFVSNILHIGESFAIQFIVTKSGNRYELATFRKDVGGGRKPDSVEYVDNPEEDSKRRDLTINALFYEITGIAENGFEGDVLDFVGGVNDVKNNVINTVGNPTDRFDEDPLRKIRAIRFAAKMGSKIPDNVAEAIREGGTSLTDPTGKMVSLERIRDEFYKGIKSSKSVKHFLELLKDFDFFKYIFGNLTFSANYFIEEKNPIILVSNLLKDNNVKNIEKELNFRKYSTDEISCIIFLVSLLSLNENTVSSIKKLYLQKAKSAKPKINEKIYSMTEDMIYSFANISHIDRIKISNFLRLANEFIQPSELLKSLGYQERELGMAIARLEKEFYKNPDMVKRILDSGNSEEIKKIIFISKS